MTVLVTGSSGKLGGAMINLLRSKKIPCKGIDIVPSTTTDEIADFRLPEVAEKIMKGMEYVIHTAALHGLHFEAGIPRSEFIHTNILGSLNLLQAAVNQHIKRFVLTSTTSIYGRAMLHPEQAVWVDEKLNPIPRDIYDITKQAVENLCADFMEKENLSCCSIRISRFLDEPANVTANHRLYRGLDVHDGAEAHLLALTAPFNQFEIFNISGKSPFQQEDLITLKTDPKSVILKYFPQAEAFYQKNNWQFPASIDRVYVTKKAEKILGYQPRFGFGELIS